MSAKLDMDFMSSAEIGQEVEIEARINRIGRGIAFTEGRITDLKSKKIICVGTHIKAFIEGQY